MSGERRLLLVASALVLSLACRRVALRDAPERELSDPELREVASAPAPPSASAPPRTEATSPPPSPAKALPPLSANWLEPLDLGDGASAVVSVPLGATSPRPLVVAVHGAHDRPEWACGGWRLGFQVYPFIVCPRGSPVTRDKYAWANAAAIERVVMKSIEKVRERFGSYVAPPPYVYAGFSQGAIFSEPILVGHAALFKTAVLAEGGYAVLSSADFARKFKAGGGETVVIVCGSPACRRGTQASALKLQAAGLRVFESGDVRSGHNLNQLMQQALERDFASWFADDPAWAGAAN